MKLRLLLVGIALALGACKSAPPPGKVVALENVCEEADGTRVRLTGHVRYERGLMSFCSSFGGKKTCDLELYATAEAPQDFDVMHPRKGPEPLHAELSVPVGSSPGEMDELPQRFTDSDVVVHLEGDKTATEGSRVTIDGKVSVIPASTGPSGPIPKRCYVDVEWARGG